MIDKKHTRLEESAKKQTEKLVGLLESNTALTQQDKDLTDEIAQLTRETHAALTKQYQPGFSLVAVVGTTATCLKAGC